MTFKYFRIKLFKALLQPFSRRSRRERMGSFEKILNLQEGTSILDLGGLPMIWDHVSVKLNVTILNLPGNAFSDYASKHNLTYVEGDACAVTAFPDRHFDVVFSNSVIEHVGDELKQRAFATEVRRLGISYWVQTPSRWFPIEAHCGMPFWWFYPARLRDYFMNRWQSKLPKWTEMVAGTTVLDRRDLEQFFPEAQIWTERRFGLPKSYAAYFRA